MQEKILEVNLKDFPWTNEIIWTLINFKKTKQNMSWIGFITGYENIDKKWQENEEKKTNEEIAKNWRKVKTLISFWKY